MEGPSGASLAASKAPIKAQRLTMADLEQLHDKFGFIRFSGYLSAPKAQCSDAKTYYAGWCAFDNIASDETVTEGVTPAPLPFPGTGEQSATLPPASPGVTPPGEGPLAFPDHEEEPLATMGAGNATEATGAGCNNRRTNSRARLVEEPHHSHLGTCAGMTMEELFRPHNGKVEAMINEKYQTEKDTEELLIQEKVFNKRIENALKHKFGPDKHKQARASLKNAQNDAQHLQKYIAMLIADESNECNPSSACIMSCCVNARDRAQKKSQSSTITSSPTASYYATPDDDGSFPELPLPEESNASVTIDGYVEASSDAATRCAKRSYATFAADFSRDSFGEGGSKRYETSTNDAMRGSAQALSAQLLGVNHPPNYGNYEPRPDLALDPQFRGHGVQSWATGTESTFSNHASADNVSNSDLWAVTTPHSGEINDAGGKGNDTTGAVAPYHRNSPGRNIFQSFDQGCGEVNAQPGSHTPEYAGPQDEDPSQVSRGPASTGYQGRTKSQITISTRDLSNFDGVEIDWDDSVLAM
ncbi:hypothetical protein CERZMDRAFT_102106 [Cercospora zeae-maydis SCOH1-5]|uniref:Uncharacterized protein n=1 Tax=Cercospora zeae-maydis SCOH1-5 TaxID=717836 RepID=A0A6A6F3V2_9PEZI|nr:hypothetical protein CERZMDRAFT_102106 [Cercospora zeae-maydis SCOH1-5]